MDRNFLKLLALWAAASLGFSILMTPGDHWSVSIPLLKKMWMVLLAVAAIYGTYLTFRRPPGL